MIDSSHAICGIITMFDQPGRGNWSAEAFRTWLDLEVGLPIRANHGPLFTPCGTILTLGAMRRFAPLNAGLLGVGEIDHGDYGDSLLYDLGLALCQRWLPSAWGMSITVITAPGTTDVFPVEVSVTQSPQHAGARVLGVGADAIQVWKTLTGENEMIGVDN
jgi:hypothetical protein